MYLWLPKILLTLISSFFSFFFCRTAICYVFLNVAIGVGFVCVLYMWVEDLISTGNVVRMPETQELFLLALIYDVMTRCYGKFAHLWAFMSYLLITLAGIISMVSWYLKSTACRLWLWNQFFFKFSNVNLIFLHKLLISILDYTERII